MQSLYKKIEQSITTIEPELDYQEILSALIDLCILIEKEPDNSEWIYIEGNYGSLPDLLIASYWHLSEWHSGQTSISYAALCSIGAIFSPGMTSGPEPESAENDLYLMLNDLASEYYRKQA